MLPDTPEELLREIFRNLLYVPIDIYFSQTDRFYTEFPAYKSNLTSLLLVCKKWLRIATPLLYETIGIGTEAQMGRLAYTLRSNPTLGVMIRNLRLDGGFGKHLYTVAKCAPHIQTLSVRVHPGDRGANVGYLHALPSMKPTTLYVHGLLSEGHSKKQRIMVEATFLAIRAWLPLKRLVVTGDHVGPFSSQAILPKLLSAIEASSSLQDVGFSGCLYEHILQVFPQSLSNGRCYCIP
ncbi:hypothetical protein BC629DRAFT_1593045 [Irpex lacteus]|nr:hypothetical protein BC629DRAFT_1593045 [Irpex lacteus]